jgi:hypothetical protein
MNMKPTEKKVTYDESVSFLKYRLDTLKKEFEEKSREFIWQTQHGGGIQNIHMLHTIRDLNFLYTDIAAHIDALRSLKVDL